MFVGYAWDQDSVHLDDLLELQGFFYALELVVQYKCSCLEAFVFFPVVGDVVVDLLTDLRVHRVHSHGYVADAQAIQLLDLVGKKQAVGAYA